MRIGRVVVIELDGKLAIGQVATLNPQGGATVKTTKDGEPITVEKFHKLHSITLQSAVTKFGANIDNTGVHFPNGIDVPFPSYSSVDPTDEAAAAIGVALGEESVPSPFAPPPIALTDELGDGLEEESEEEEEDDEEGF